MPPRNFISNLPTHLPPFPLLTQTCPRCSSSTRQFSSSSSRSKRQTRLRRQLYAWLNGPGQVFHDPLPNSTNYLSAYDKAGRLVRARDAEQRNNSDGDEDKPEADKEEEDPDSPEAATEESDVARLLKEARRQEQDSRDGENGLPPESLEDLRPFPQNAQFMSQPVLSVELRNEIFHRVKDLGLDVRTVSAQLGVAIERAGAVVRLKAVEEDWIKKVCDLCLSSPRSSVILRDEINISISLEDNKMVTFFQTL